MNATENSEVLARRFHQPLSMPSVFACAGTSRPMLISHVASEVQMASPTLPPPVEDAYSLHVNHVPFSKGDIWLDGKHQPFPETRKGSLFIWDMRTTPVAQVHQPFAFSRFELKRSAIQELAYEQGFRHVTELRAPFGVFDPVLHHLTLALTLRYAHFGTEVDSLFVDGIALAFFLHVMRTYGSGQERQVPKGALAPWQLRRIEEWVDANLNAAISIDRLASLLGLSASYFARTFVATTGMPPHRWLTRRRIAHAKTLLRVSDLPLSVIASTCGFVDQSHFTRVFARLEGQTPARSRQARR